MFSFGEKLKRFEEKMGCGKQFLAGMFSLAIFVVMLVGLLITLEEDKEGHQMTGIGLLCGGSVMILILMLYLYISSDGGGGENGEFVIV